MIKSKNIPVFWIAVLVILSILIIMALSTFYYGSTDIGDYTSPAKYFSGDYSAKLRTSHSLLYGFIQAPLVHIMQGLWIMKILGLVSLIGIVFSVYYISKDKRSLVLLAVSPVVWYMAPWINPIQLASLIFLWAYFFIEKFDKTRGFKFAIYAGILLGLASCFWNTLLFISIILMMSFFLNRNVNYLLIILISFFVGLLPLVIFDFIFYGFPLYSLIKFLFGTFATLAFGSIYASARQMALSLMDYISFFLVLPFFSFKIFKKSFFLKHPRQVIFITLSFIFFLVNPQVRYLLLLIPILMLYLPKILSKKELNIQIGLFIILSLIIFNLYAIQISYSTNAKDMTYALYNLKNLSISQQFPEKSMAADLNKLIRDHPNETFIVGNKPDDYQTLATLYWGKEVQEFVSIQDYELWLNNNSIFLEKTFKPKPKIEERRQIWISGGISKNENDKTDYGHISFGIGLNEPPNLKGFEVLKQYGSLYLSKKVE